MGVFMIILGVFLYLFSDDDKINAAVHVLVVYIRTMLARFISCGLIQQRFMRFFI